MNSHRSPLIGVVTVLVIIATLGGIILISYQISVRDSGGGSFWIEWIGIRAKVVDGISPYSETVNNRIQEGVGDQFNWALSPEPVFTSPLYSAIISIFFALIPDANLAHTAWLTVQFVVILGVILAGIHLTDWKPRWWVYALFVVFLLLSMHTIVSWYEGSMMIWAAGLVVAMLLSIRGRRFELAGMLLGLCMIQPQAVILLVMFVLLWAISRRKWSLIIWFASTLVILVVIATVLVPGWLLHYLRILWNYGDYFTPGTPGFAFQRWWPGLGRQMGWVLTVILGIILLIEWRLAFRQDFRWFLWTACLTIVVSQWIGLPSSLNIHILLNLPLIFVFARFDTRWPRGGKWVAMAGVGITSLWEWWLTYRSVVDVESTIRLGLMFPVPLLLLVGLFWVRWWSIRPKRLLIDELRSYETP